MIACLMFACKSSCLLNVLQNVYLGASNWLCLPTACPSTCLLTWLTEKLFMAPFSLEAPPVPLHLKWQPFSQSWVLATRIFLCAWLEILSKQNSKYYGKYTRRLIYPINVSSLHLCLTHCQWKLSTKRQGPPLHFLFYRPGLWSWVR